MAGLINSVFSKPDATHESLPSVTATPYGMKRGGDLTEDLGRVNVLLCYTFQNIKDTVLTGNNRDDKQGVVR